MATGVQAWYAHAARYDQKFRDEGFRDGWDEAGKGFAHFVVPNKYGDSPNQRTYAYGFQQGFSAGEEELRLMDMMNDELLGI